MSMHRQIRKAVGMTTVFLIANMPAFAVGGGRLASTQVMVALSGEVSGPMAYAVSIIAIVAGGCVWAFNHHEMTASLKGIVAVLFAVGFVVGATGTLSLFPGLAGALI